MKKSFSVFWIVLYMKRLVNDIFKKYGLFTTKHKEAPHPRCLVV